MTDNKDGKDRCSALVAATPRLFWDGFNDHSATQKDGGASDATAPSRSAKKPYGKPTYRFERVFETMALSCGKVGPVEFQCRFNRKNS